MFDPTGFSAKEWYTIDGERTIIHLSDGSILFIEPTDLGFQLQREMLPGFARENLTDALPMRAGALEFMRRWIGARNLSTVPNAEQKARHDAATGAGSAEVRWNHDYRAKHQPKPKKTTKPVENKRYFHHPESDSIFTTDGADPPDDPFINEITAEEFTKLNNQAPAEFDAAAFAASLAVQLKGE